MTDIQVYDNFLSADVFDQIKNSCDSIDWKYDDCVANRFDKTFAEEDRYNWQMVHIFYNHPFEISQSFSIINPLVQRINPIVMYRAKLNLNPSTEKIIEHGYHQDYQPEEHGKIFTSAVYYLNNNNGYTRFQDGTKVESVENRLVTFPTTMFHTGSSCTDSKNRLVLNLVYVQGDPIA